MNISMQKVKEVHNIALKILLIKKKSKNLKWKKEGM